MFGLSFSFLRITKRRIRNCCLIVIIIMILFYAYIFLKFKPPNMKFKSPGDGYEIKTIGCSIPSLHPFDPAVIQFIFKDPPVKCSGTLPALVSSNLEYLYVNIPLLSAYKVKKRDEFYCCYQEITKKQLPPGMYREISNDTYSFSRECIRFTAMAKIDKEYIRVICKYKEQEIYRDFHSFVPKKKSASKKPSVLVIGMDSTSRINLHRQMPKTVAYLKELNAIEFFGYNKVGHNTFPNLIPALTGKTVGELKDDCLTQKWFYDTPSKFDSCKFIWNNYKRAGFLTALAEDGADVTLFNNGYRYGFLEQPTDYYWNLFSHVMETTMGSTFENKTETYLCIGSKYIYQKLLEYMNKFVRTLENESFFGWFWQCTLTHSNMNLASLGDEEYEMMFEEMNRTNVLNNTFIVFLSDHGQRSGRILLTHQGYLEGRLPFLYLLVPPWFEQLYPKAVHNLKINTKRLITTFDLYETLNDLIYIENLTTNILQVRESELENNRGISLFLPIPEERTCASAGISINWCSCFQSVPVETTDKIIENIAYYVVNYLNFLLDNYESCAKLALNKIIQARLLISEEIKDVPLILKSKLKLSNYIITILTAPGGGIFESTVRCTNCEENGDFEIQGVISRLNKYGKDADCIIDQNLRLYCYCKK